LEKTEGKGQLGRRGCSWKNDINMKPKETGYEVEWIHLAKDRVKWRVLVNEVMNIRVS